MLRSGSGKDSPTGAEHQCSSWFVVTADELDSPARPPTPRLPAQSSTVIVKLPHCGAGQLPICSEFQLCLMNLPLQQQADYILLKKISYQEQT